MTEQREGLRGKDQGGVVEEWAKRRGKGKSGDLGRAGQHGGHLTSHPPVLLQLPGGYEHSDLSVSAIPEVLHGHGNASA